MYILLIEESKGSPAVLTVPLVRPPEPENPGYPPAELRDRGEKQEKTGDRGSGAHPTQRVLHLLRPMKHERDTCDQADQKKCERCKRGL